MRGEWILVALLIVLALACARAAWILGQVGRRLLMRWHKCPFCGERFGRGAWGWEMLWEQPRYATVENPLAKNRQDIALRCQRCMSPLAAIPRLEAEVSPTAAQRAQHILSRLRTQMPAHAGRTRMLVEPTPADVRAIEKGYLHVVAEWSGAAESNLHTLERVVDEFGLAGKLDMVYAVIEQCSGIQAMTEFAGRIHGNGETAWICHGKVLRLSRNKRELEQHAEAFEGLCAQLIESAAEVEQDAKNMKMARVRHAT